MTKLDLHQNNLTHLPLALAELSSLQNINLLRNRIVKLDAQILANISSSLNNFHISVDRFSSFPNELRVITTLSELTINGITFPMLNSTVFHNFEHSLVSLEMSHSSSERIPAAVCRLKSLKSFTSNHSPNLSRYHSSIFDACTHAMTNVTSLRLQYYPLTSVPMLVHIFPKLEKLYFAFNDLRFFKNNTLAGLTSLTLLDLDHNKLTLIPFAINMAVDLRDLGVRNNQIFTVEDGELSRLHNLTTLYLDGNPIVHMSPFASTHNVLLNDISMFHTNIGHVPRAPLGLTHLHNVHYSGKDIECSCRDMHYLKSWNVTSINIDAFCSSGKALWDYLTLDLPKCP